MEHPLSPFMFPTWYRFQITSLLSIVHRLTGIALAVGSILLAWWLVAVAAGGEVFAATHAFIASPIGVLLLFGWSVAFFYHLCSGIRHLAWDAGYGFEIREAYRSGYAVLAATDQLTAAAWLASPVPALLTILFVLALLAHAVVGMRSVLVDYVHRRAS